VNAAQVLDHFDRISDAPDAIPRLRRFILDLAVRGKLVKQDANEEPASELLKRIKASWKPTSLATNIKEVDLNEPTSQSETAFELPGSWEWVRFGLLPIASAVGIDRGRQHQGSEKMFGYFKMNNIRNSGGIELSHLTRIDADYEEVDVFSLHDGDFLFNTRNSRELVGKTCVYRPVGRDVLLYNNNILRVKFTAEVIPEFVDFWFRSGLGRSELERLKSNTTNVCAIYQGKLYGFPCPLPPLAEQHRIVAKVDELMALCDWLDAAQAERESRRDKLAAASLHRLNNGADADEFREHARFHLNHLPRLTSARNISNNSARPSSTWPSAANSSRKIQMRNPRPSCSPIVKFFWRQRTDHGNCLSVGLGLRSN
jgi:type I restriction enzyme S subunit